jgi:glutathione S-transferase
MTEESKEATPVQSEAYEWTVVYHPCNFKGRGEFLRLMLEDAKISYKDTGTDLYGPSGMMDAFRGSVDAVTADEKSQPFPLLYPPAILHRPVGGDGCQQIMVNQVGACMIYLGDELGYAPTTHAEKARANCVLLNSLDYISEGRSSFHPVDNKKSYKDQKDEGDRKSKLFSQDRMLVYLHYFNKIVKKNGKSQSPIAGGSNITYADFALFQVVDATAFQFNSEFYANAWDSARVPELKEHYVWMKARPNLQAYFASDRCKRTYYLVWFDSRWSR